VRVAGAEDLGVGRRGRSLQPLESCLQPLDERAAPTASGTSIGMMHGRVTRHARSCPVMRRHAPSCAVMRLPSPVGDGAVKVGEECRGGARRS
jgi:hypothetical protein